MRKITAVRQEPLLKENIQNYLYSIGLLLNEKTGQLSYDTSFRPINLNFHLIYVRHGQTRSNAEGRFQGQADEFDLNTLNDTGFNQAIASAKKLQQFMYANNWMPTNILASPLQRTIQTGKAFIDLNESEFKINLDESLKEIDFGEWSNKKLSELPDAMKADIFGYKKNHNSLAKSPHGESFAELLIRVYAAVTLLNQNNSGKNIIIFGHSAWGNALSVLCGLKKADQNGIIPFRLKGRIPNGGLLYLKPSL